MCKRRKRILLGMYLYVGMCLYFVNRVWVCYKQQKKVLRNITHVLLNLNDVFVYVRMCVWLYVYLFVFVS